MNFAIILHMSTLYNYLYYTGGEKSKWNFQSVILIGYFQNWHKFSF